VTVYVHEPIQDLARPGVASVPPEATLREVAVVLTEGEVGLLAVSGPEGMLGVISERDIAAASADGADPDEVWASDVMTDQPLCVDQDDCDGDSHDRTAPSPKRSPANTVPEPTGQC
jgi:CBS domain-containing protein